jgi:hypothetical protein
MEVPLEFNHIHIQGKQQDFLWPDLLHVEDIECGVISPPFQKDQDTVGGP